MEKVPLAYSTGGQKPVKMPRRLVDMRGPELVHNKLVHKQWGIQVNTIDSVLEITPEIPEIAGKNTSIPAMIVYLPENSAGRYYWLLFITYLLVRWKIFNTFNRKLRKTII